MGQVITNTHAFTFIIMGYIGTTVLALITFLVNGQQLQKIVTTYPNSQNVKEVYFVLQSNQRVKQGDYFLFFDGALALKEIRLNNITETLPGLKARGQFVNNLKDGKWTYFKEPTSNQKLEEGNYTNGQKTGVWETHVEDGKVVCVGGNVYRE